MQSKYINLGGVIQMPAFAERKLYMHKTRMDKLILPNEFQDYLEPIERTLSKVSNRNNVCYITIDEKVVNKETHRRGGIHVDYNWYEGTQSHLPSHRPTPIKLGKWDNPSPQWKPNKYFGTHGGHTPPPIPTHHFMPDDTGGMLLVSNYAACQVWRGKFNGEIGEGGDCRGIDVSGLETEIMPPNEVYFLNSLGIHESLPINEVVERSLIRINFHPEYKFAC